MNRLSLINVMKIPTLPYYKINSDTNMNLKSSKKFNRFKFISRRSLSKNVGQLFGEFNIHQFYTVFNMFLNIMKFFI